MENKPEKVEDYKRLLLELVASATLADHMGDMWNDLNRALKIMGEDDLLEDHDELSKKLFQRGITTIWGTEIGPEDDE